MGRGCTMDEWVHFERLPEEGRVPNSSYWYVHCRHCVRGYAQKQLINPPTKLTGRRSAMKAHLKVCPLYATQYKMEQRALAAAAAAAAATASVETAGAATPTKVSASDSTTPSASETTADAPLVGTVTIKTQSGEKRKRRGEDVEASGPRGGRGKHCMMEEWEHFIRLQDEGYIGKSNFFFAVCRHCQAEYDNAPEDKKPLLVPEKMVGRREKMRKHLAHCAFFQGELPSLETRAQPRLASPGGGPNAFLPLPTADGIKMVPASALASVAALDAAGLGQANGLVIDDDAQSGGSGSARLALDEWQYFTRLHRKKDSAYYFARCNFCQQAFENAPEALRASMTPTVVMGRKSNMQTHLAKCPYVPKDTVLFSKAVLTGGGGRDGDGAAKRLKLALGNATGDEGSAASGLHQILVEVLLQHRLPFEWIDSLSAKKLLRLAASGAHVNASLVPTSEELRGPILDDLVRLELQPEIDKLKQVVSLPPAPVTDAVVGEDSTAAQLPVVVKVSVRKPTADSALPSIECSLSGNGVSVPLHYVVPQREAVDEDSLITGISSGGGSLSYYHGLELARFLSAQLRRMCDDHAIAAGVVLVPHSPIMNRAVGLLRTQWPSVAFVRNLEDMVAFCLLKALENPVISQIVTAVSELLQVPEIHAALAANGVDGLDGQNDWTSFASLAQELASDRMAAFHPTVDAKLDRATLFRVSSLFRVLAVIDGQLTLPGRVTLADTLSHLATLYAAADGFDDVQLALEIVWHDCEQPLYLLAHALHPHLRLRGVASSELTKFSVLSDLAVAYFAQFLARKPQSLRGDMTSYLHKSQNVFIDTFVAEFPLVDDYFRYLRDDFPELSALMQLLQSFSVHGGNASTEKPTKAAEAKRLAYSEDELKKLSLLEARWGVETMHDGDAAREEEDADGDVEMTDASQTVNASVAASDGVVASWVLKLHTALEARMVDFSNWETAFASGAASLESAAEASIETMETAMHMMALPSQAEDDEAAYVAAPLTGHRAKKVRLAQLFGSSESTTV